MMVFIIIIATAILLVPSITAEDAKQSAWISTAISMIMGFITLAVVNNLARRFPQQTLPQYLEILLGKIFGKIICLAYIIFFLIVNVLVSRVFSDFLNVVLLPETPKIILISCLILIGAYAAANGIEVIARMTQFILPLFIGSLLILILLVIPDIELGKLQPVFEEGIGPVISASTIPACWFGEIVILLIVFSMANKPQEIFKIGTFALLSAGMVLTALTICTLGIFGPNLTGDLLFPVMYLAKYIKILRIERLEALFVFIWVTGVVVKVSVFYYCQRFISVQVFRVRSSTKIIIILAIAQILAANYLFGSTSEVKDFIQKGWPPIAFVFELVLPLMLLLLAVIKRKKVRRLK